MELTIFFLCAWTGLMLGRRVYAALVRAGVFKD
jgi:hypothetical protein